MAIEVEQKFSVSTDTRDKLVAIGATRKGCKSFTDIYYDTGDHSLTFQDFWLRKRDGSWQLKSPLKSYDSKPLTDKYKETETEDEILEMLRECGILSEGDCLLEQLLDANTLVAIAELTTRRETWLLSGPEIEGLSGGNVVLDSTNEGYEIGEVEVMVDTPTFASKAEEFVKDLATKIGMCVCQHLRAFCFTTPPSHTRTGNTSVAVPGGKLSFHLCKVNHSLWQQLIDRNVMRRYARDCGIITTGMGSNVCTYQVRDGTSLLFCLSLRFDMWSCNANSMNDCHVTNTSLFSGLDVSYFV